MSKEIVKLICKLPKILYKEGNKSIWTLIREIGESNVKKFLTAEELEGFLAKNPELIKWWFLWSENKRTSSGWFFLEKKGSFLVGFYPDGPEQKFSNEIKACAHFIVQELQEVMKN